MAAPYRSEGNEARITGEPVTLSARQATPVGLVLHELATNAVKYGAWAGGDGAISIDWKRTGDTVELKWTETGERIRVPDGHEGFGSMLMRSAARQLDGAIDRSFSDGRMVVDMRIPQEG